MLVATTNCLRCTLGVAGPYGGRNPRARTARMARNDQTQRAHALPRGYFRPQANGLRYFGDHTASGLAAGWHQSAPTHRRAGDGASQADGVGLGNGLRQPQPHRGITSCPAEEVSVSSSCHSFTNQLGGHLTSRFICCRSDSPVNCNYSFDGDSSSSSSTDHCIVLCRSAAAGTRNVR